MKLCKSIGTFAVASLLSFQTSASLVTDLVFKLSDSTADANKLDAYTGWQTSGDFGSVPADLTDDGADFRSSLIDTNWNDVTAVRVSMYLNGSETAYLEFDATGTTSTDFFSENNLIGSSNSGLLSETQFNYFSIEGHEDTGINRNWFINSSYNGCPNDFGYFAVTDGAGPCSWENDLNRYLNDNNRGFYYSELGWVNWPNSGNVDTVNNLGIADVFAVHVTREVSTPATLSLFGIALLMIGRNKRHKALIN
tara:strand:- start:846 stop:1601 length:756 start_codon:yes stop_codon:yes gene_type:complete